jgi:hypothetical protein
MAMLSFTRFCLRVLADLNEIIRRLTVNCDRYSFNRNIFLATAINQSNQLNQPNDPNHISTRPFDYLTREPFHPLKTIKIIFYITLVDGG